MLCMSCTSLTISMYLFHSYSPPKLKPTLSAAPVLVCDLLLLLLQRYTAAAAGTAAWCCQVDAAAGAGGSE
jgi:hypothetical protein